MTVENIVFGEPGGRIGDRERGVVTDAIAETDWEETAVLDVVKYRPVSPDDGPPRAEYEVHRHAGRVPDYDEYADPERKHEVRRITEDACVQAGIDPETGDPAE